MNGNFNVAVDFVLAHEGEGKISFDLGGATRWGIAERYHPGVDVRNLTREQAIAIYNTEYWQKCGCDALPGPLDILHFDTAVNLGPDDADRCMKASGGSFDRYALLRIATYADKVARHPERVRWFHGWVGRVLDLVARFKP